MTPINTIFTCNHRRSDWDRVAALSARERVNESLRRSIRKMREDKAIEAMERELWRAMDEMHPVLHD